MIQLGILSRTFERPTLGEVLQAVGSSGLRRVQFNLLSAGLPTLPERLDPDVCQHIRQEMAAHGISMAAISGTFNLIHPEVETRNLGLRCLRELASNCKRLGTSIVTLCTGTRDPMNMWRRHPDNDSPLAWKDLVSAMGSALQIAEDTGVTLAFEPEVSNVVDSAPKARRLLDEVGSPRLKVVLDPANLFHRGELPRMRGILDEAFELLGNDIVLAHAKDLSRDGEAGHEAAGTGLLDYDQYLSGLHQLRFEGALILHGLSEHQVGASVDFLRKKTRGRSRSAAWLMPFFEHAGLKFHYRERGEGLPFVFQHGLGGEVNQPFGLFEPPKGVRLIAFDFRGHGETRPLGDPAKLTFNSFSDDLLALLAWLKLAQAVVGGISMGAGVALNFALRYPGRALGLVLSRPAWLDQPLPANTEILLRIAELIRSRGAREGLETFRQSEEYSRFERLWPETASSLVGQFQHPRAEEAVARLERMARDVPNRDPSEWSAIRIPTLVLANRADPIHPYEYGQTLARAIPSAVFRELTSKSVNQTRHAQEVQQFLAEFLHQYFINHGSVVC